MTMISTEPKVDPAGLYTVKQTAEALGVCISTVQRYRRLGILRFTARKGSSRLVTTGRQILKAWAPAYPFT